MNAVLCLSLAAAFIVVTPAAHASHYLIADVPDVIQKNYHAKLAAAGIHDTKALFGAIATKKARRDLAKKVGVMYATLTKWATFIDLMRVDGIGPKMVRLLNASDVKHLKSFVEQDAAALHPRMRQANRGGRYSEVVPGVEVVRSWIQRAQSLPIILQ